MCLNSEVDLTSKLKTCSPNLTFVILLKAQQGSTENAGRENGGPKKDERTENAGLKMKDQMSGVENAGPENAGPKHQDRKMEDQQPEADYEI